VNHTAIYPSTLDVEFGPPAARNLPSLEAIAAMSFSLAAMLPFSNGWFRRSVSTLVRGLTPLDQDFVEDLGEIRFIPDGYCVTRTGGGGHPEVYHIWAIEVEDSNKLTPAKLHGYIDLWEAADLTSSWDVHLIVTDRYGRGGEINLAQMRFARFLAKYRPSRRRSAAEVASLEAAVRAAKEGGPC
jgi:hypothetical protein